MNKDEANKIIAEFMGYGGCSTPFMIEGEYYIAVFDSNGFAAEYIRPYSESLDALVPVWEKLDFDFCLSAKEKSCRNMDYSGYYLNFGGLEVKSTTLQEAAAIATAKAILELNKRK